MNLFDILGPVMVGPSSSHTAGAVRLGRTARRLLGEGTPREAAITLFGSFAATGHGHGTDRALIAGLLGFQPDDERIARSFDIARDAGMAFSFTLSRAGGEHPNTARIDLVGQSGKTLSMTGSSLGGGRIMVVEMNGLRANFSGDMTKLIVQNVDQPGHVSEVREHRDNAALPRPSGRKRRDDYRDGQSRSAGGHRLAGTQRRHYARDVYRCRAGSMTGGAIWPLNRFAR